MVHPTDAMVVADQTAQQDKNANANANRYRAKSQFGPCRKLTNNSALVCWHAPHAGCRHPLGSPWACDKRISTMRIFPYATFIAESCAIARSRGDFGVPKAFFRVRALGT